MNDERNFRSTYYERVGCRGVEEKKSLEILMKEKPWDKMKLKQFCLRYTVPAAYRNLVWKVLLDILPVYPDSHQFVMEQRIGQFEHLKYAVETLDIVQPNTPACNVLLEMWLLENEDFLASHSQSNYNPADTFLPITKTLLELYTDEVDVFWFAKMLTEAVGGMQKDIDKLKVLFLTTLEKEDYDLYSHLVDTEAMQVLPLNNWFNCCFAGVLDETSLTKIWDKICCGASKILPFVAVMVLKTLRRTLMKHVTPDKIYDCVEDIADQCEEVVANKAIELWQYYGTQPQNDQIKK